MTFTNVQVALVAAAVAVPLLVLFYFLKLRRRQMVISSTLLWLRSVQDLHVNAFFQWLKHNWLLWLQLGVMAVLLTALAHPILNQPQTRERRVVLMVDTSASMAASDDRKQTRLQRAVEEARKLVEGLGDSDQAMVITFAEKPQVLGTFTSIKSELHAALDAVRPTHERTRLAAAMQIVDSLTRPTGVEPTVYLFSDGRIPDSSDALLWGGEIRLVNVGRGEDNVAITGLSVRRNYQKPDQIAVQCEVRNFCPEPVELDVQLVLKNKVADTTHVKLAAFDDAGPAGGPDRRVVRFDVDGGDPGIYMVSITRPDALAADNSAAIVLPQAKRMQALLVTGGNYFLEPIMRVLAKGAMSPLGACKTVTPADFETDAVQGPLLRGEYDLVVLDGYHPDRLVPGKYLMFHVAPKVEGVTGGEKDVSGTILTWDRSHPVLRHVSVELLYAARWLDMQLPAKATLLVEANTGPVIADLLDGGSEYLIVAFDPLQSNWPLGRQFAIFMANAVQYLGAAESGSEGGSIRPGASVLLPAAAGVTTVRVSGPGQSAPADLAVGRDGQAYFDGTELAGIYTATGARAGRELFAVNLFDPVESRISPLNELTVGMERLGPQAGVQQELARENVQLMPWLLWLLLGLLLVEWLVYLRKVRI